MWCLDNGFSELVFVVVDLGLDCMVAMSYGALCRNFVVDVF
jgi:hypothetical protein